MAASLRAGVAALPAHAAGAFVFLGDMPLIPHEVLSALAGALAKSVPAAATVFGGGRGHPVLFGRTLFGALMALTGDEGARKVLSGLGSGVATVETLDRGVLFDVDVIGDLVLE